MKKIILIVFPLVALCCGTVVAQADADKIWDDANTAYINADYVAAIDGYEKLLDSGLESDRLYLNLGNAYFKRGMNGKAILNYNRALKLAPPTTISVTTCRSPTLMCRTRSMRFPFFSRSVG